MSNTCYPLPSGSGIFEVHDREWKYVVDIAAKKCECRRWDLIGIPCSHAIACLKHERIPEDSVLPHCYSIEAFQNAYNFQIFPCSDKTNWQNVGGTEVKPPKYEKKPGRPAKQDVRQRKQENQLSRKGKGQLFNKHMRKQGIKKNIRRSILQKLKQKQPCPK
ncbi:uncharacterized protein [Miscanthus floridulus]|uniref:uncharacterized protein n=1 Tax=Miscanthus floridulus TaxID=154761 RepID=UPI0034599E2F